MGRDLETLCQIDSETVPAEIKMLFLGFRKAIKDAHENGHSQGSLDPNVVGVTRFHKFSWDNKDWAVHSDCHAGVLLNFIFDALQHPTRVGEVVGRDGGKKLGIFDKPVANLQVYRIK